jgi:hypothetical protein
VQLELGVVETLLDVKHLRLVVSELAECRDSPSGGALAGSQRLANLQAARELVCLGAPLVARRAETLDFHVFGSRLGDVRLRR